MVFGFGQIHAGTADNIIPDQVTLSGSIRTATPEDRAKAIQDFERIVQGVVTIAGGEYELDVENQNPSVYNDPALVHHDEAVTVAERDLHIMGYHHRRHLLALDYYITKLEHNPCRFGVKRGRMLVEQ